MNPLQALGIPSDLPMTPDVAVLLHELMNPRGQGKSESEYDEEAEAMKERMDRADSWEQATVTGYKGPRGTLLPVRAPLPDPIVACFTEIVV